MVDTLTEAQARTAKTLTPGDYIWLKGEEWFRVLGAYYASHSQVSLMLMAESVGDSDSIGKEVVLENFLPTEPVICRAGDYYPVDDLLQPASFIAAGDIVRVDKIDGSGLEWMMIGQVELSCADEIVWKDAASDRLISCSRDLMVATRTQPSRLMAIKRSKVADDIVEEYHEEPSEDAEIIEISHHGVIDGDGDDD